MTLSENMSYTRFDKSIKVGESDSLYFPDILHFNFVGFTHAENDFFEIGTYPIDPNGKTDGYVYGVLPKKENIEIEIDGCILATFSDFKEGRHESVPNDAPILSIYQLQPDYSNADPNGYRGWKYSWNELSNITGAKIGSKDGYTQFLFNFSLEDGKNPLVCSGLKGSTPTFFSFRPS